MREFFRDWRRKFGALAMVTACWELVLFLTSRPGDTGAYWPPSYVVAGDFLIAAIIILWPEWKRKA